MDRRLLEAAQKGDVGLLNDLIRSNALILEEAALQGAGNTPLHVACVAGHSNFIRELLKLMPKLVKKVNADGFSPLHIAAARGDVETVREILKAGSPQLLCFVKGREGRIPLHCAAANGEVGAMKELLSASPESIEETTAQEETALHLAVKNNRCYALFVLVEHLKQHNKEQVIHSKDKNGDNILRLATVASNFEVASFLRSEYACNREFVEVNTLSKSRSTPPDVLPCSNRAGGQHGQSESLDRSRSDLLVVAVLIATATFQVVIQPITLFKRFEFHSKNGALAAYYSFLSGRVWVNLNLGSFLATNTLGFFLSVIMINRLSKSLPFKFLLKWSIYSLVSTYMSCLGSVPSRSLGDEYYSPLADILISHLATLIAFAYALVFVWEEKWINWIQARIAQQGGPQSRFEKKLLAILTRLALVDAPGNA